MCRFGAKTIQVFSFYVKLLLFLCQMKKRTTLDVIGQSDRTTLYSISFERDGTTEFEKILNENLEKGFVRIEEKELTGIDDDYTFYI